MTTKLTLSEEIRLAALGEVAARKLLGKPACPFVEIVNEVIPLSRIVVQPPALPAYMRGLSC
jgi:hypothetical protein